MDRRKALRLLAGAASVPFLSRDLTALGRELHAQLPVKPALRALTPQQDAMVTLMAELIIPATDTPGAKAARVNEFIDLLLADWWADDDRKLFLDGLAETDRRSREMFGKNFVDATPKQQNVLLTAFDQEVAHLRETAPPFRGPEEISPIRHFFFLMKRFTMIGYYTSQIGAEQELHFEMIPPRFRGCVPLNGEPEAPIRSQLLTITPAPPARD